MWLSSSLHFSDMVGFMSFPFLFVLPFPPFLFPSHPSFISSCPPLFCSHFLPFLFHSLTSPLLPSPPFLSSHLFLPFSEVYGCGWLWTCSEVWRCFGVLVTIIVGRENITAVVVQAALEGRVVSTTRGEAAAAARGNVRLSLWQCVVVW